MDTNITKKIIAAAKKFSIEPALFLGLIEQESDFNPNDERYESRFQDYSCGLTQIMIATAASLGFPLTNDLQQDKQRLKDVDTNLYYGAMYLRSRMDTYSSLPLIDQIRTYNSGSPLDSSSSFYADNQQYGINVLNYYKKWQDTFNFDKESNLTTNFVLSGILGIMAVWIYKKLKGK